MAQQCDICGKKPSFGMNVSHSHRRTKRRWNPNVQRVRALVDGAPKLVLENVNKEAAEKAKGALEGAGATVTVK